MNNFENHPLYPEERLPIFIAPGVLKQPAQLEPFLSYEDPMASPTLYLGVFTLSAWAGNAKPGQQDFIYYPDKQMAGNCRGMPNDGKDGILALKEPIRRLNEMSIRTIIQVSNLPFEDPIEVIPELIEIAASVDPTAVEVNLSCPNGKKSDGSFHEPVCNYPDTSGEVMVLARARVGYDFCLGAKDSPHTTSLDMAVNAAAVRNLVHAVAPFCDFLCGINTLANQSFPELDAGNGRAGMSGPIVASIAKQHLKICVEAVPDLAYLSCGGVDSENAAQEIPERQMMGAMLVGGAQDFYRTGNPARRAELWMQ